MADEPRLRYIRLLPAIYQRGDASGQAAFLDAYLSIFQTLLDRNAAASEATASAVHRRGMAELIDVLPNLIDPRLGLLFPGSDEAVPPLQPANPPSPTYTDTLFTNLNDYIGAADPPVGAGWQKAVDNAVSDWLDGLLDWFAAWVGLTCDNQWSIDRKRQVIATILPLYRQRGTSAGLAGLLNTFIDADITVRDVVAAPALVVGRSTTLADDYAAGSAVVGGVRPFSFQITLTVPTYDTGRADVRALVTAIHSLADREKPAHTNYTVNVTTSLTRLGTNSIVGKEFLIPRESRH